MIEQSKIDLAKLQMRGRYGVATGSAVSDQVLLAVALDFDNQVMRKMLSLSPNDLAARLTGDSNVLVATKVDGEGTYVYFDATPGALNPVFAFSAGGRVRLGFPALDALCVKLKAAGVQKALLRCELCLPIDAAQSARAGRQCHCARRSPPRSCWFPAARQVPPARAAAAAHPDCRNRAAA